MEVLEKVIIGYKNRMAQIEADPSLYASTDNNKRWIEEKNLLLKDKEDLVNKCKQLEHSCASLRDQIDHRALKGDFNLRETKVVHYKYVFSTHFTIQNYNFVFIMLLKE